MELHYGIPEGYQVPAGALAVDYDLRRLAGVTGPKRCAELADLEGTFDPILMNVLPYTPSAQLSLDFAAAATALTAGGVFEVVVHDRPDVAKRLHKQLHKTFAEIGEHRGELRRFTCREPIVQARSDVDRHFEYYDKPARRKLKFSARPGLFSSDAIDPGTQLLMDAVTIEAGKRVLDLGCGYGAMGVVAAARGGLVTMLDVDVRAIAAAQRNLSDNELTGEVRLADGTHDVPEHTFDAALSNLPTHAGSPALRAICSRLAGALRPGGYLAVVIREQLNYEPWLRPLGTLSELARARGYKVLKVVSPTVVGS